MRRVEQLSSKSKLLSVNHSASTKSSSRIESAQVRRAYKGKRLETKVEEKVEVPEISYGIFRYFQRNIMFPKYTFQVIL